jgi:hypothetical protein
MGTCPMLGLLAKCPMLVVASRSKLEKNCF